ncbi:MAG: prenyltransferase/squalene oxidase repeat-containing protein [Verrucomicrobiota bacterium]
MKHWGLILLLSAAGPVLAQQAEVTVDRETAEVIRGGLKYLAAQQQPNGAWTESNKSEWETAITGYALMAFLATGNLPNEGEFGKVVAAGQQFLLASLQTDGKFTSVRRGGQYMYGHGIATIVLAELYGQTKADAMRPKLEKAVQVIVGAQNREGGWRYAPVANDADISVTVLQVVALRAAKEAGLNVPQTTLDNAVKYIHACYDAKTGGFSYQPRGAPGFARTAAAIYSLQVLGQYDDPQVKTGSEFLTKHFAEKDVFVAYGHFYAGPAEYMIGGETWKQWYTNLRASLLKSVRRQGDIAYWERQGSDPGAIYTTAVYTSLLALPYHYVPLYQR